MSDFITTAEVAERLGVSPSAISYRVKAGTLKPVIKMPGKRGAFLFDPKDLEPRSAA